MMLMYALERRGNGFILAFALGCPLSSLYGFLSGAWPSAWSRRSGQPLPSTVSPGATLEEMLERAQTRMLPVVNRAADYTPMAATCCNACRTCVTTNILGLAFAAAGAVAAFAARFTKRITKPS